MLEYRALGGLCAADNDGRELSLGGSRQRRLTAALLIDRNRVVSVDRLAEVVFAGEPTPRAATTMRSYVARLRRVVEDDGSTTRVVTRAPGYMLTLDDEAFDVARFESSVAAGRARLGRGDAAEASQVLRSGLALWRGGAYAEFADEEWARPEAQRLDELRLVAYELLADADLARGRAAETAAELEVLTAEHPLRAAFQARLMLALYRSGRQVEALRAYQVHRGVLSEEFGLEPPPELAELEARILAHDDTLLDLEAAEPRLRGYRLGERLGTGRDGTVYAACIAGVERDIAIRVVPEPIADDADFVRSFDADARRLGSLHHAAVIPLYDWWREPGAAYLVMRRLRGGTLRDRLQRGPLPAPEVAALVARLRSALAAAEEAGVAHGRLVPESVLFDEAGDGYLADFPLGTAGAREPSPDQADLAALAAEALTGPRATDPAGDDLPDTLARVLAGGPVHEQANPYKGLRAFDEPDAADFFGRDALVDEVLARLASSGMRGRLVLVVGGSGSGKSSVVRAGVVPRVRGGGVPGSARWFVAAMVPGASPFAELAEALRLVAVGGADGLAGELAADERAIDRVVRRIVPGDGELLLVVDQLEELFTLADEGEQRAFLDALMYALGVPDGRLRVVATLRADFYDRPLRYERFGAAVGDATVPIAAMSAAELEAAIVGPAERVGGRVAPALVAELVGAVLYEPAALPSLQFALYELAERSPDRQLGLDAYRALGGVDAAIAARAEELYCDLENGARDGVRRLFERLVVVGAEGEPTRRRALRSELEHAAGPAAGDVLAVIEAWAQARLLSLDRHPESRVPTVEVAHEALLREWPRLRAWLEEDRERIVALGHLRESAASWDALDRDAGALYRGARLDTALALPEGRDRSLPPLEHEFVEASRAARDREREREAAQLARTARANRRLRAQLVAVGVALVVALIAGALAVGQRNRATHDAHEVAVQALVAEADVARDTKRDLGALLALAAYDADPRPETFGALLGTFTAAPGLERTIHLGDRTATTGALLPDGRRFAVVGPDLGVRLVDLDSGRSAAELPASDDHRLSSGQAAVSPDGRLLAVVGLFTPYPEPDPVPLPGGGSHRRTPMLAVRDLESGEWRFVVTLDMEAGSVAFSRDSTLVAVAGGVQPTIAETRSADDGDVVAQVPRLPGPLEPMPSSNTAAVAFLPDGSLALTSAQGPLRIVNPDTGAELRRHDGPPEAASAVLRRSANGRTLYGSGPGGVWAWSVDRGMLWDDPDEGQCQPALDERGGRLLCGIPNGEVVAYDTADGRRADAGLEFQHGFQNWIEVSPDGTTLVEGGAQGIAVWRLDGGGAVSRPLDIDRGVVPRGFLGDSDLLLVGAQGGPPTGDLAVADVESGTVVDPLDGVVGAVALDAPLLGVGFADGTLGRYDVGRQAPVPGRRLQQWSSEVTGAEALDDRVVLWGPDSIQGIRGDELVEPKAQLSTIRDVTIRDVTISRDGSRVFTLEDDTLVARRPDGTATGRRLLGVQEAETSADLVVVATPDGRLDVLDAGTLEPSGPALPGSDSPTRRLDLTADGRRLLVLDSDRSVRLADLRSRQFLGDPIDLGEGALPNGDQYGGAIMRDDGDMLAVYGVHGTVVWDLAPERLMAAACRVAGRNLTETEWAEHVGSLASYHELCPAGA